MLDRSLRPLPLVLVTLVAAAGCDDGGMDPTDAGGGLDAAADAGPAIDAGPLDDGGTLPAFCGGPTELECDEDAWCDFGGGCGGDGAAGICQPRPEACDDLFFPVCGCDGETYENPCAANAAGVAVDYDGRCDRGALCGVAGIECEDDEWCDAPAGSRCATAVAGGVCRSRPVVCPTIWAPVCGCDGETYPNACDAHAQGIDVAYDGECAAGRVCGGVGGFACAPGEYCDFPDAAACGLGDTRGLCEPEPIACPGDGEPVCGCDGVTYPSACAAAASGVDAAHPGSCVAADPCAAQDARGSGECATPLGVYWDGRACRSVSGCECAGADCDDAFESVDACEAVYGECTPATPCDADADCADAEWCDFPIGALCGADDREGVCRPRPEGCLAVYRPVCGCDGGDYGNACEAAASGTDIAYRGACDGGDRCAAQDVTAVGPCAAVLGWFWDGASCVSLSGCECRGSACGFGWSSRETCESAHLGCDTEDDACTPTDACPGGQYCDYDGPTCGGADPGVCRDRPAVCPPVYALVCGCDGVTYTNACEAASAGQDVRYPGACITPPDP
ncbi:MAG TPA: Kazal-type serine protease inhibitor domain-containing protein [Sandaracinaceae bacterium LLY-WYZ-13_1]|nr:Kazal-type serine protease inhibitor domain-containing protein [Sandaracinaceae bacterium LLY-WYZ-13_1]